MMSPDSTVTRISAVLDKFQKAAASKSVLEEQIKTLTTETEKLDAELTAGLAALGYNPTLGQTPDQFLDHVAQTVEAELKQFEQAVL